MCTENQTGGSNEPENDETAIRELLSFLQTRLPRQYVSRYVEPMKVIPKTNTGKVRKVELRTRAEIGRTFDREIDRWVIPKSALS